MKSLEQIAHGTECGFNRTVEVGSEGGVFDSMDTYRPRAWNP